MAALLWGSAAVAQPPQPAAADPAQAAAPAPTVLDAIGKGKPILEVRARYETVDQAGIPGEAVALTLRTRLGWETAAWNGLKGLVEVEDVHRLGAEHYNIAAPGVAGGSLNGRTTYPIVNDPQVTELNRAQIAWTALPGLTVTGGRQRIVLDDQRFIGNVGWRQDEQTFDAVRVDLARGRLKATYAYVGRVNRIFGQARDWESDSHILNATYAVSDPLKLQGFLYALDFSNAPINATRTWGAKVSGKGRIGHVQLAYDVTWARQTDYRRNTPKFALGYWGGDVAATAGAWTAKGSYEVLEGDGTRGFITPLATTHGFQGWADAFAAVGGNKTFVDGIRDLNLQLVARPRLGWAHLSKPEFLGRWHDFKADRTGAELGHEWDLQATAAVTTRLSVGLKYADFTRVAVAPLGTATPPASRTKVWFTVEYRL